MPLRPDPDGAPAARSRPRSRQQHSDPPRPRPASPGILEMEDMPTPTTLPRRSRSLRLRPRRSPPRPEPASPHPGDEDMPTLMGDVSSPIPKLCDLCRRPPRSLLPRPRRSRAEPAARRHADADGRCAASEGRDGQDPQHDLARRSEAEGQQPAARPAPKKPAATVEAQFYDFEVIEDDPPAPATAKPGPTKSAHRGDRPRRFRDHRGGAGGRRGRGSGRTGRDRDRRRGRRDRGDRRSGRGRGSAAPRVAARPEPGQAQALNRLTRSGAAPRSRPAPRTLRP